MNDFEQGFVDEMEKIAFQATGIGGGAREAIGKAKSWLKGKIAPQGGRAEGQYAKATPTLLQSTKPSELAHKWRPKLDAPSPADKARSAATRHIPRGKITKAPASALQRAGVSFNAPLLQAVAPDTPPPSGASMLPHLPKMPGQRY